MTEPIIVPAARVVLKPLLFAFATLAGYFVAWGLVFVMDAVVRAFFGTATGLVGWVPFAGRIITSPLLAIEHKLTSYLGGLEAHFDRQMAARWHALASLVSQLALDTKAAAVADWQIARKVATLWGNAATGGLMKDHAKPAKTAAASAAAAQRSAWSAQKAAQAAQAAAAEATAVPHAPGQTITRSYPRGKLGTRLAALAAALGGIIEVTLPGLRARDRWLTDQIGRLWHRTRGERSTIGLGAFIGLLTLALGKLGLGWLRCTKVNRIGKHLCRMNTGMFESFMALLTDFLVLANICTVIPWLERGFSEVAAPLIEALTTVGAGLCGRTSQRPGTLSVPTLHLPATTGYTLYLP